MAERKYHYVKMLPLVPFVSHKSWYDDLTEAQARLKYLLNRYQSLKNIEKEQDIVWTEVFTRHHKAAIKQHEELIIAVKSNIHKLKERKSH